MEIPMDFLLVVTDDIIMCTVIHKGVDEANQKASISEVHFMSPPYDSNLSTFLRVQSRHHAPGES